MIQQQCEDIRLHLRFTKRAPLALGVTTEIVHVTVENNQHRTIHGLTYFNIRVTHGDACKHPTGNLIDVIYILNNNTKREERDVGPQGPGTLSAYLSFLRVYTITNRAKLLNESSLCYPARTGYTGCGAPRINP